MKNSMHPIVRVVLAVVLWAGVLMAASSVAMLGERWMPGSVILSPLLVQGAVLVISLLIIVLIGRRSPARFGFLKAGDFRRGRLLLIGLLLGAVVTLSETIVAPEGTSQLDAFSPLQIVC